jgi:hypothetical protein
MTTNSTLTNDALNSMQGFLREGVLLKAEGRETIKNSQSFYGRAAHFASLARTSGATLAVIAAQWAATAGDRCDEGKAARIATIGLVLETERDWQLYDSLMTEYRRHVEKQNGLSPEVARKVIEDIAALPGDTAATKAMLALSTLQGLSRAAKDAARTARMEMTANAAAAIESITDPTVKAAILAVMPRS